MIHETGFLASLNKNMRSSILTAAVFAVILFASATQAKAQLDPSFGVNGISTVTDPGRQVAIATFPLAGGKILVVSENLISDRTYEFVRFNADGSKDATYGSGGVVPLSVPFINTGWIYGIYGAARQSDGKIILVGSDNENGLILRFNDDGSLDSSFGGGIQRPNVNSSSTDRLWSAVVQPDGKIVVGGDVFTPSTTFLIRYNSNGTLDNKFGSQIPGSYIPTAMSMESTGKIIALVGAFNGGHLVRYNTDGTIDGSFPVSSPPAFDVYAFAIQPDDKIITSSYTVKSEPLGRSNYDSVITRLNSDATVDSGFGTAGSVTLNWARYIDDGVGTINVLKDGQILVSGNVYIEMNRSKYRDYIGGAALLSSTGTVNGKFLMPGFRGASGPSGSAKNNVVILPNGKVLFSGPKIINNQDYDLQMAQITGVPTENYHFKGNPFDFKNAYNGAADIKVFRPSSSTWYSGGVFGLPGDIIVPADYIDKEYAAEFAVFRPSNGTWYISQNSGGGPTNIIAVQWGQNGDIPTPADFDGDGKADLAVFRPSTGVWYILHSSDNSITVLNWGLNGDKPVPGDYDGDGRDDIAVFRPSNGTWYMIRSTDGLLFTNFGLNGDVPVQEDYDGDGKTDIAVWRPSDGIWYRINSSNGALAGMQWGLPDDVAVPGDYDGDLKTDIAVWRPNGGQWYIYYSSNNSWSISYWGVSTDIPVEAKY